MRLPFLSALFALAACAPAPHIVRIQPQNGWLTLNLATANRADCGSINIGAERIVYVIACNQGGKANLPRQSVRLDWQAGELVASHTANRKPLFRVQCSQAQFNQITAWQNATPSPKP